MGPSPLRSVPPRTGLQGALRWSNQRPRPFRPYCPRHRPRQPVCDIGEETRTVTEAAFTHDGRRGMYGACRCTLTLTRDTCGRPISLTWRCMLTVVKPALAGLRFMEPSPFEACTHPKHIHSTHRENAQTLAHLRLTGLPSINHATPHTHRNDGLVPGTRACRRRGRKCPR